MYSSSRYIVPIIDTGGDEVAIKRVSTSVSLPPEIAAAMDARRGYLSRSAWIVEVIRKELEREASAKRDPLQGMVKRVNDMGF